MTRGRSQPGVKSHRRGRRRKIVRRKLPVAPWIVISTVLTLVASGLVGGYMWLLGTGCSGTPIRAVVAAAPSIQDTLTTLARQWEGTEPAVEGQCISVEIKEKASVDVATQLPSGWDTTTDGARPHIWIPESTAWLQMARLTDAGKAMIPTRTPLVATSPTVIAMPQPMAKALGWQKDGEPVDEEPRWSSLVQLAKDKDWGDYGEADWGDINIGMSNPKSSTPGLHALLSVVDANQDGSVNSEELDAVVGLRSSITESVEGVDDLIKGLSAADADGDPMGFVSAFPALERDVYNYNRLGQTDTKLEAVPPADGSTDADHPFAVLQDVDWTNKTYQEIGRQFGEYLISEEGQELVKDAGFRDGTHRTGGDALADTTGMVPQIDEPQREPVDPSTVSTTIATWQAINQATNVLFVVDTSESMLTTESLNQKEQTRLDIVKDELKSALGLFGKQAKVGLWQYSSGIGPMGEDYNPVLNMDTFDDDHQAAADAAIDGLEAGGDSGLYDTAVAAYTELLNNYNDDQGATNLVVLISDGGNEDPMGGLSADDMRSQLEELRNEDRGNNASIVTIGYGKDANADELEDVANATKGTHRPAQWSDEINAQLLSALFYAS